MKYLITLLFSSSISEFIILFIFLTVKYIGRQSTDQTKRKKIEIPNEINNNGIEIQENYTNTETKNKRTKQKANKDKKNLENEAFHYDIIL